MALADDIKAEVKRIFESAWTERDGQVVPEPANVKLDNEAVKFDRATVLYADLDGSTNLVDEKKWWFAAEVYRTYLYAAAKVIRSEDGVITAYDGDRVMAVFIGDHQSTQAARCALKINSVLKEIVNPALVAKYPSANFTVKHVIGIDTSPIRAARIGVRGGNDLVWVGRAANYAAKLANLSGKHPIWITKDVFNRLNDAAKYTNSKLMWTEYKWNAFGDKPVYGSSWTWKI